MSLDLLQVLERHTQDKVLGGIVSEALAYAKETKSESWQSPGVGQSSLSVAKTYRIRKSHKTHRPETFSGLEESISSLEKSDVIVHLSVIETNKAIVSIWLTDSPYTLVGIVIGKLL